MLDPRVPLEPSDWRSPHVLLAVRLSLEFGLDVAQVSRGGGDLLDPLLSTAMLAANQAILRHDARLAALYSSPDSALPDEHRRPISINALAKSLRLPFENVRRRVRAWEAAGQCVQTIEGVYIPAAVVTEPAYRATQAARLRRLELFLEDLAAAELQAPTAHGAFAGRERIVDRALGEYMLRFCDRLIELADGPVNGFMLMGLCALNVEHVSRRRPLRLDELVASARPCSTAALARRVGMPAETVRRHAAALAERGLARRGPQGWLAAAPAPFAEPLGALPLDTVRDLRRLLAQLSLPPRADEERFASKLSHRE